MKSEVYRPILISLICLALVIFALDNWISKLTVFGPANVVHLISDEEQYLTQREIRNIEAMHFSYEELIKKGDEAVENSKFTLASGYFFYAKTIFPDRVEARLRLCYSLMKQCPGIHDKCRSAKRELYYVFQYIEGASFSERDYANELRAIMAMDDIVNLEEAEAMRHIY